MERSRKCLRATKFMKLINWNPCVTSADFSLLWYIFILFLICVTEWSERSHVRQRWNESREDRMGKRRHQASLCIAWKNGNYLLQMRFMFIQEKPSAFCFLSKCTIVDVRLSTHKK